jgi:bifunctional non-homologous end joining protein LigD
MDLDPEGISFEKVIKTAQTVRKVLDQAGVESYCKTSGATGLYIYIPLGAQYSTDQVIQFGKILAYLVNARIPEITSVERMPVKRKKKVYLDYLQNRRGQSIAAVYSVRHGHLRLFPLRWNGRK